MEWKFIYIEEIEEILRLDDLINLYKEFDNEYTIKCVYGNNLRTLILIFDNETDRNKVFIKIKDYLVFNKEYNNLKL